MRFRKQKVDIYMYIVGVKQNVNKENENYAATRWSAFTDVRVHVYTATDKTSATISTPDVIRYHIQGHCCWCSP